MPSSYPSNLTYDQWKLLESLIPAAKPGGRPRSVNMQAVVNAILYILCAGCAWRMLPSDFPCWKLENGLPLLASLANGWHLGAD